MKGNSIISQQMMAEPISESTIGLDLGKVCYADKIPVAF
jgi:hypothetical protein